MSIALYRGSFDDLAGGIFASWFTLNPEGPMAFAVGFVETADTPWSLFYRRMQVAGARTFLGGGIKEEMSACSGNFHEAFFNHMLALNNYFALRSRDEQLFSEGVPTVIRTNGNPEVEGMMRWLIQNSPRNRGKDWDQEHYLRKTYGASLACLGGSEFREAYKRSRKQAQPANSAASFERWWTAVTNKAYVEPSIFQFAKVWAGAHHPGSSSARRDRSPSQRGEMSYSELARFFDRFHMPLLSPEIDEVALLRSQGLH